MSPVGKDDRRWITVRWAAHENQPAEPVGVILIPEDGKVGGFRYLDSYAGPPLSPDLDYAHDPRGRFFALGLNGQEHLRMRDRKDLHQVFLDALPGGWGETVMISHARTYGEASPANKLWMLGDRRVGALVFETGGGHQLEHWIDGDIALNALRKKSQQFLQRLLEDKHFPFAMGTEKERWALTVNGGATPKCAFRGKDGTEYVAKFSQQMLGLYDTTRVERAMLQLSADAGIDTVDAMYVTCSDGEAVLCTKRYDTLPGGSYAHHINAATALDVPLNTKLDYSEVADFLRGNAGDPEGQVEELYARMLFNAYTGNTDDHLGQFEFVQDGDHWKLAPNLDLLVDLDAPTRPHRLTMAGDESPQYTSEWIEKTGDAFGLDTDTARRIAARVVSTIRNRWDMNLRAVGLDEASIAEFEPAIQPMRLAALSSELAAAQAGQQVRHASPELHFGPR